MSDTPEIQLVVRDAMASDAETIAEFNVRLAEETESIGLSLATVGRGVDRVLGDSTKGRYFVAEGSVLDRASAARALPARSPQVVGCTMITYEFSDWRDADLWWIQSVYVRSDWRRRGVFRALYRHVRQAALAAGVGGLRLYVEKENRAAQRTYQSLGMALAPYMVMSEMFRPLTAGSIE